MLKYTLLHKRLPTGHRNPVFENMKRAVILDRDGVINDNSEFVNVHSPAELILFPTSAEAIRLLNENDFLVCVATNQGGVGLGYLTLSDLRAIHRSMKDRLALEGAKLDDIVACTHRPSAGCQCRKPRPGMLLQLQRRHKFDLSRSYMVGDRETDIHAGKAAGARTVLIGEDDTSADYQALNLLEAVHWILQDSSQAAPAPNGASDIR